MKFPYEVGVQDNDDAIPPSEPVILRTAHRAIADEIAVAVARQGIPAWFRGPERDDGADTIVRYERNDPALDERADEAVWAGQAARARLAAHEMSVRGKAIPLILDRLQEMRALTQNPEFRQEVTNIRDAVSGLIFAAITPIETVKYGIDVHEGAQETLTRVAESWDVPVPNLLYCHGCGEYHPNHEHDEGGEGLAAMLQALTERFTTEAAGDDPAAA